MGISPDDPRAAYQQIADDLRQQIASGALEPGARLPSTRELMDRYDVANNTAQSAIRALRDLGLVETVAARGTFVRTDFNPEDVAFLDELDDSMDSPLYLRIMEQLHAIGDQISVITDRLDDLERRQQTAEEPPPGD